MRFHETKKGGRVAEKPYYRSLVIIAWCVLQDSKADDRIRDPPVELGLEIEPVKENLPLGKTPGGSRCVAGSRQKLRLLSLTPPSCRPECC